VCVSEVIFALFLANRRIDNKEGIVELLHTAVLIGIMEQYLKIPTRTIRMSVSLLFKKHKIKQL
jgi:hypothetical protein